MFLHGIAQRAISLALLQAYYYSPMCNKQSIQAVFKKGWNLTPPANYHIEIIQSFQTHFDHVAPSDLTLTAMESSPCLRDSADSIEF